jgi:hypothetical protein
MQQNLEKIKARIDEIKRELQTIGEMRPGSLTKQYISPKEKKGAYYQISYTLDMKSRTDYVRKEFVEDLKRQIKNYKRFKKLSKQWVDFSIRYSKMKIELTIKNK